MKTILKYQIILYFRNLFLGKNKNKDILILLGGLFFIFFKLVNIIQITITDLNNGSYNNFNLLLNGIFIGWIVLFLSFNERKVNSVVNSYNHLLSKNKIFFLKLAIPLFTPTFWILIVISISFFYPIYYLYDLFFFILYILFLISAYLFSFLIKYLVKLKFFLLIVLLIGLSTSYIGLKENMSLTQIIFYISGILPSKLLSDYIVQNSIFSVLFKFLILNGAMTVMLFYIMNLSVKRTKKSNSSFKKNIFFFVRLPSRIGELIKRELHVTLYYLNTYVLLLFSIQFFVYLYSDSSFHKNAFFFYIGFGFIICLGLFLNCFGFNTQREMKRFGLFPLKFKWVLISKNISIMVLLFIFNIVNFLSVLFKHGIELFLSGVFIMFSLYFLLSSFGNRVSIYHPERTYSYRLHSITINEFIFNFFAVIVIIFSPILIESQLMHCDKIIYFFVNILMLIFSFLIYKKSLVNLGEQLEIMSQEPNSFQRLKF